MADSAPGNAEVQAHIAELKLKGRESLVQAEKARQAADEARTRAELISKAAKDLQRQIFHLQLTAGRLEAEGDADGARRERKVCDQLRRQAEENFRSADEKGAEAAQLERKAYKLKAIAMTFAEQIRGLTGGAGG